jgi:hypothetical protein
MKKVTLIALMAILCLSGMAQKKKGTVRKTVSKNIVINFNAQGELGIFALRGPVKECVWTTKDQTRKLVSTVMECGLQRTEIHLGLTMVL